VGGKKNKPGGNVDGKKKRKPVKGKWPEASIRERKPWRKPGRKDRFKALEPVRKRVHRKKKSATTVKKGQDTN